MRGTILSLAIGVLLATGTALRAQTNLPMSVQSSQQGIRPPGQAGGLSGISVGGPYAVLTDEQRVAYQAAMKAVRGELGELNTKLLAARQEAVAVSVSGKFDENLFREKSMVVAKIEVEMSVIRARVFSQIQPPLSTEQIEKIKSGQTTPARPLERPMQRPVHRDIAPASTNSDINGLPPKQ